jgi:hypothetical protein
MREVDPGLLEHGAVGEHPAAPTASAGPLPAVLGKARPPLCSFQGSAETVLEIQQIVPHCRYIGLSHDNVLA